MSSPSPLPDALCLDLDDTILEFDAHADPSWQQVADLHSDDLDGRTGDFLRSLERTRKWYWGDPERHRRGRLAGVGATREIVALTLEAMSLPRVDLAGPIAVAYSERRLGAMRPFPGALETLRELRRRGLPLALLTNGDAPTQRGKIERFDLARHFDCIVVEGEFGVGKPDPRVFEHALSELGVGPESAWMVGDNLTWDVAGAQRVGMRGIWVDHRGTGLPADAAAEPDGIVLLIRELLEWA
jgi:putative hydrolase of the HAD superfamily